MEFLLFLFVFQSLCYLKVDTMCTMATSSKCPGPFIGHCCFEQWPQTQNDQGQPSLVTSAWIAQAHSMHARTAASCVAGCL
eukprot:181310-Lingulodinium_polyedra.AAC.1